MRPLTVRKSRVDGRTWYAVYRGDERQSERFTNRWSAEMALDRIAARDRPQARRRRCLCCGTRFLSEHSGHRMCNVCRPGRGLPISYIDTVRA